VQVTLGLPPLLPHADSNKGRRATTPAAQRRVLARVIRNLRE
jgi:hypothetical protein